MLRLVLGLIQHNFGCRMRSLKEDTVSEDGQETKRIFCNWCKTPTKHVLSATHSRRRIVEEGEQPGEITTSIWSCSGCEDETFEWKFTGIDEGEQDPTYFPPRVEQEPRQPKVFHRLKPNLNRLYVEIVDCLNRGSLVLCSIGLRALMEGICRDQGLTDRKTTLEDKINGLRTLLPSTNLIDALHAFRFAGNDAAHENAPLTRDEAILAIEVIEDLLNFLYDLDYKASQMKYGSRMAELKTHKGGTVQ